MRFLEPKALHAFLLPFKISKNRKSTILQNLGQLMYIPHKKYILKNTEIWPPQAKILWTPLQANNEGVLSTLHL